MANVEKPKKLTRSQRRTQKMKEQFPELTGAMLWSRGKHDGFTTVPRTMPLIMKIIDAKSEKGHPAGHTLLCLWTRAMDHPYLVIDKPRIFASEAGLIGERAESSWRKRMSSLVRLGFILAREGASGPYHHVVLLNPHVVATRLNDLGQVQKTTWDFFKDRAEEVGALPEIMEAMEVIGREKEEKAARVETKNVVAKKNVRGCVCSASHPSERETIIHQPHRRKGMPPLKTATEYLTTNQVLTYRHRAQSGQIKNVAPRSTVRRSFLEPNRRTIGN